MTTDMNMYFHTLIVIIINLTFIYESVAQTTLSGPKYNIDNNCQLSLDNENVIRLEIQKYISVAKLIEYNITFSAGTHSDIPDVVSINGTNNYKILEWEKVFSRHGQALLSLPFNYKILSLSLLSYGVVPINVQLNETPSGCFANLDPENQLSKVGELVMHNFEIPQNENDENIKEGHFACHKVIRNNDGIAHFDYDCCTRNRITNIIQCHHHVTGKWIDIMLTLLPWIDVVFFLLFPLFVLGAISKSSFRTTNYMVKLKEPQAATVRKDTVNTEDNKYCIESKPKKNPTKPSVHRKCIDDVRKLPWNKNTKVCLPLLHILVDHKQLMSENDVNIGFRQFIWTNLFLCRLRKDFPFVFCCRQSIFGSWKRKFFCCPIPGKMALVQKLRELNRKYRGCCSWQNIFRFLSFSIVVFCIPFPYYIEVIVYLKYDEQEVIDRQAAGNSLDLLINRPLYVPFFHKYFIPFMPIHLTALIIYAVTSVILLVLYQKNSFDFVEYLVGILRDFKHLERIETFRMLALQIVMPFEKFGIFGLFIGPICWIITIPFGILTIVYYCVPTLYLILRLCFIHKPKFIRMLMCHKKTHSDKYTADLEEERKITEFTFNQKYDSDNEDDVDTCENLLLLQKISPINEEVRPVRPLKKDGTLHSMKVAGYTDCQKVVLGICISFWMVSLLLLYADFFGFAIEILTLTFMGAIANAGSVGQYFFFTFFIITYTRTVLNKVNEKYQQMASELFSHIKTKLDEDLSETVILRGSEQKNFAYKFFSKQELRQLNKNRQLSILSVASTDYADVYKDKFEMKKQRLHLRLHSVVLFLDKHDKPRIPKQLFDEVCQIKCPGCPGPIYKSLLQAIKELGYLIVFLFFVFIVVMAFGDVYEISTTNQLLLTVVGGFAPFVVRFVMAPKSLHVNFSTYSFKGKVHEIISAYIQSWPVYDIEFDISDGGEDSNQGEHSNGNEAEDSNPNVLCYDRVKIEKELPGSAGENTIASENSDTNKNHKSVAIEHNTATKEEEIPLVEIKPEKACPKPRRQMTSGRNNNIETVTKANLYKLDTVSKGVDLVFHMRIISDDEEETDPLIMS